MVRPLVKGRMGAGRRRHFDAIGMAKGRVVFLGDSLTEGGMWPDLFPDLATSNRGIGGEATYDLLERVDDAINDPVAISLMIGTNDLHGPRDKRDNLLVADRFDEIVRRIRTKSPSALLLVNSVLPRTELFAARIRDLNERYQEIAARYGAVYVDLWPTFADASGAMKKQYSRDSLHLTPAGYLAWTEVLRPYLHAFSRVDQG
jgi:lysophospholipase L1-like esterase